MAILKSLKEVSELVGLSRRIIQEFEDKGVIKKPAKPEGYGKNSSVKLMYDEKTINDLWRARFCKELGYTKRQTRAYFQQTGDDLHESLNEQITKLEEKIEELKNLVRIAKDMNQLGITPATYNYVFPNKSVSYDEIMDLLKKIPESDTSEETEYNNVEDLNEEELKSVFNSLNNIHSLYKNGSSYSDQAVQNQIKDIHAMFAKITTDSVLVFTGSMKVFAPGTECGTEMDEVFSPGMSEFFYSAIMEYNNNNFQQNSSDSKYINSIGWIIYYYTLGENYSSENVLKAVKGLYDYFSEMKFIPENLIKEQMKAIATSFGSNLMLNMISEEKGKEACRFVEKAIDYYIEKNLS